MRWPEYVPVHQRRKNGRAQAQRAIGKGKSLQPIQIEGRKIAKTFWGIRWCEHLEAYSDFANRLPRGRTYARNGSIMHLEIAPGKITAMVAGSELYKIQIKIDKMPAEAWNHLCEKCASSVTSTIDLLRGKLPEPILTMLTNPANDLFPRSKEIRLKCNCPDGASLCKHLAAVLYGVGSRLDDSPKLLFVLRGVDQNDLIGSSLLEATSPDVNPDGAPALDPSDLEDIFGIELDDSAPPAATPVKPAAATQRVTTKKRAAKKRTAKKKSVSAEKKVEKKRASKTTVPSREPAKKFAKTKAKKTSKKSVKKTVKKPAKNTVKSSNTASVIQELVAAVNGQPKVNFSASGVVDLPKKSKRGIAISGMGDVSLPLRPKDVREIIDFADTAPYGKGTRTIIDQSVRNSLEIKASKLTISADLNQAVQAATQRTAIELGLPEDRLQAKLYKLLIYQKGGFFLPHRDSEKRNNMVASMVVMLPSKYGGGELVVEHQGTSKRFPFSGAAAGEQCEFAAFYADCLHEVRKVTRGVRVCLSYNLCLKPPRKQRDADVDESLVSTISHWTESRPADPMVFALEHQYTATGLKPSLLKGNDRAAAERLIAAGHRSDCHVHFGQVSRHLVQFADDGSFGRGRHWQSSSSVELSDLHLGETYEDEVVVDGWKDASGKRVSMAPIPIESSMLISNRPLHDWKPTSFDYEGYTGNAGNTLDRWFHKSAIVIWSKANHFDIVLKMGHRSSVDEFLKLQTRIANLDDDVALEQACAESEAFARAIIRAWPRRFVQYDELRKDDSPWFERFADALPTLENPELIDDFLQTLATRDWQTRLWRLVSESCKRFDSDTMIPILERYLLGTVERDKYGNNPTSGLPIRDPEWLFKIATSRNRAGLRLDQLLALMNLMFERLRPAVAEEQRRHWSSINLAPSLVLLMKCAIATGDDTAMSHCLRLRKEAGDLFDRRDFDAKVCTDLVQWSGERFGRRLESQSGWLQEIRRFLEAETHSEPKPPSDFARPDNVGCTCPYCRQLCAFLGDPELETGEIKGLKAKLTHVQDQLKGAELDAEAELDRSTRPFTLKLTKTLGSYVRAVKRFEKDLELLASLP